MVAFVRTVCIWALTLGATLNSGVHAQNVPHDLIPPDATAQGFQIDNEVLPLKRHALLPNNINLRNSERIDSRFRIANLIADEAGDYERERFRKVVRVDNKTGEVTPTPYQGNISCFADGNLALSVPGSKTEKSTFSLGRFGEALQSWSGGLPAGFVLNDVDCKLIPTSSIPTMLKDGRPIYTRVALRSDHGRIAIVMGQGLPSQTADFPPELKRLMQQPFMRSMSVLPFMEEWYLITADEREVRIANNPGETLFIYGHTYYLPYLDAYLLTPYAGGRPADPDWLNQIPRFARILHPDGRVERYGVPDVIWEPYQRGQLSFRVLYTKRGLIWILSPLKNFPAYQGDLQTGAYLDLRGEKKLKRLPDFDFQQRSPKDGCTLIVRRELAQRYPYFLFNYFYFDVCTGE